MHESPSAQSPSDVAWEMQTDRVFGTHHTDWLSFSAGPLDADSDADRPDPMDSSHSLHETRFMDRMDVPLSRRATDPD